MKRQKRRKAIVDLRISEKVVEVENSFLHTFTPNFRCSGAATQSLDAGNIFLKFALHCNLN